MDEDRDRDPQQSTGLSSKGPVDEQKVGEDEQGSQDREGLVHSLRQSAWSNGSSPNPAGLGLKEHVLNQTLSVWLTMGADWEAIVNGTETCFYCIYWLFGTPVYLDAHLSKPGWRGEGLALPTGQGTMPSPKTGREGRRASGGARGELEEGSKWKFLNGKIKKEKKSKHHLQYFSKKTLSLKDA